MLESKTHYQQMASVQQYPPTPASHDLHGSDWLIVLISCRWELTAFIKGGI